MEHSSKVELKHVIRQQHSLFLILLTPGEAPRDLVEPR